MEKVERKNYKKENEELQKKVKELEVQRDTLLKMIADLQNKNPYYPIWVTSQIINVPQIQTPSPFPWDTTIWCGGNNGTIDAKCISVN